MRRKALIGMMLLTVVCLTATGALAHGDGHGHHHDAQEKKEGILLVAFGSSEESAQVSFEKIEKQVKKAYPDTPVRWAFTSEIIRNKLAKQGEDLDSPKTALAKMADEKFTHVAVQSLHTIAGAEFHDLHKTVRAFKTMESFEELVLGNPLLATQEDMEKTVEAILQAIPEERKKDEAVVLMGHGTHHPSNAFYAALAFHLQNENSNIFLGTLGGSPGLDFIKDQLHAKDIQKAWLMPFMSVAGDHAKNDMAGDAEDSWKSILTEAGIECEVLLKGTAEFNPFIDIWLDHLDEALNEF